MAASAYDYDAFTEDTPSAQYAAEYWALDAEAQAICLELAPQFNGESVELGDLDELCRRMKRALRDDSERLRLMDELDPESAMCISRQAFTTWLLQDIYLERQLEQERLYGKAAQPTVAAVAQPSWEEIIDDQGQKYFSNVHTGETVWQLPHFISCLRAYLIQLDEIRILQAPTVDGIPEIHENVDLQDDLQKTFQKFDDDRSGALDTSEFQDFCVAIGFLLGPDSSVLLETIQQVDPAGTGSTIRWDALLHFWINHSPFQRRTRLPPPLNQWEQIEILDCRRKPVTFRHVSTQCERWCHPEMEQRVLDTLLKLFPSSKLEWPQRIEMFYDLHVKASLSSPSSEQPKEKKKQAEQEKETHLWTLATCRKVLAQLDHECTRKDHVLAAITSLKQRYGSGGTKNEAGASSCSLDPETVAKWMLHCVSRVEMSGWEELVDETTGQVYFYHELDGMTQWDPPHLETHMAKMVARFGGEGAGNSDDKIKRIFHHYDHDESGSISFDEFKRLYIALIGKKEAITGQDPLEDAQIRQVFSVLDTSGDDEESEDEFVVWWKTKMNIENDETEQEKHQKRSHERLRTCMAFLERHDALISTSTSRSSRADEDQAKEEDNGQDHCFGSNMLARLVGVLGKHPLQGLAYRKALQTLVQRDGGGGGMEIKICDFLKWYDDFESKEREKEELEMQKAQALALVHAEEQQAKEKARQLKMLRKGQLLTKAIASDATGPAEPAELIWKRHVETLFRKFDKDNSGYLDPHELKELTFALGHEMSQFQVTQMMKVMDSSGDDRVSLDEFLTFWTAFQRRKRAAAEAKSSSTSKKKQIAGSLDSESSNNKKKKNIQDPQHRREGISMVNATASLSVSLELAKDHALTVSMGDMTTALGDFKDALVDGSRKKQMMKLKLEQDKKQLEEWKKSRVFIPTKKRKYANLDVTWIEPEVVRCVVDMIHWIKIQTKPLPRQDAACAIQRLMRGVVTRMRVFQMIQKRFKVFVDLDTSFYYYVDTEAAATKCGHHHPVVWLHRPVFKTLTSSVAPWERQDCQNKVELLRFDHKMIEMQAKKRYYDAIQQQEQQSSATTVQEAISIPMRPLLLDVPSSFVMYKIIDSVRLRLLGSLWTALRGKSFVLVRLMAQRHPRQLTNRSDSDAAMPLPLHYVVQHHRNVPFQVIHDIFSGFPEAVRAKDGYGRTPLHLALRERAPRQILSLLLSQKSKLVEMATRTSKRHCVWQMQNSTGETPLHVALRYHVPLEILRWLCTHPSLPRELEIWKIRNSHSQALLHLVVGSLFESGGDGGAGYWRSVLYILMRTWPSQKLCQYPNKKGDLPLHLAIEWYATVTSQRTMDHSHSSHSSHSSSSTSDPVAAGTQDTEDTAWLWLLDLLVSQYPEALLVRRKHNSLLPIHLLICAQQIPEKLVLQIFHKTLEVFDLQNIQKMTTQEREKQLMELCTLRETNTTLLHYALLHRGASAENLLNELLVQMPSACHVKQLLTGDLPLHLAVYHGASREILTQLCTLYGRGCQERNAKQQLPLHLAALSPLATEETVKILLFHCPFVLSDPQERKGLKALVVACTMKNPNANVIRAFLDHTPPQLLTANASKHHVTPLYAISMRKCDLNVDKNGILDDFIAKFEKIDNEELYFVEMAKAKHRKHHHCPSSKWTFPKILDLIEKNPIHEAILQRAFLAMNEKLAEMQKQEQGQSPTQENDGRDHDHHSIMEKVTLNAEWLVVRRVHEVMYAMPQNARLQLLGQAILKKLLPSAYAKETYKARIDPYFNLA